MKRYLTRKKIIIICASGIALTAFIYDQSFIRRYRSKIEAIRASSSWIKAGGTYSESYMATEYRTQYVNNPDWRKKEDERIANLEIEKQKCKNKTLSTYDQSMKKLKELELQKPGPKGAKPQLAEFKKKSWKSWFVYSPTSYRNWKAQSEKAFNVALRQWENYEMNFYAWRSKYYSAKAAVREKLDKIIDECMNRAEKYSLKWGNRLDRYLSRSIPYSVEKSAIRDNRSCELEEDLRQYVCKDKRWDRYHYFRY